MERGLQPERGVGFRPAGVLHPQGDVGQRDRDENDEPAADNHEEDRQPRDQTQTRHGGTVSEGG
jgi:hypothetical protein